MNLKELQIKLKEIKEMGFIPKGSTGIGYTFEALLGIQENNLPVPDIGGRVKVKTVRKDSQSLITLFTFNRGVWHVEQRGLILKYGYVDEKEGRGRNRIVFSQEETISISVRLFLRNSASLHSIFKFTKI